MATNSSQNRSQLWDLNGTTAALQSSLLDARIDLLNPRAGLSELIYDQTSVAGSVLGITPGAELLDRGDLQDVFVRGSDLVVTYAAIEKRPFSLQVYWRVAIEDKLAVIDTILSLQTDLLESFPGVAIETTIPAEQVIAVTGEEGATSELSITTEKSLKLATDDSDCLLLRDSDSNSSYAEMTYPEDRGMVEITQAKSGEYTARRQLGGAFLEKGVIRRLRVRGVFMPQKDDAKRAAECLASLATEQPPLTV